MKQRNIKLIDTVLRLKQLLRFTASLAFLGAAFATSAWAGTPGQVGIYDTNVSHGLTFTGKKTDAPAPLALRGYDPVSYFTDGKPHVGTVQNAVLHRGAIYWFASNGNKKIFRADPDRYLPQFGGFCAFGVTQKTKFDGDPLVWNIYRGKLYVNATPDLQKKWLGKSLIGNSLGQNIAEANRIWPTIRNARPQPLFEAWMARQ